MSESTAGSALNRYHDRIDEINNEIKSQMEGGSIFKLRNSKETGPLDQDPLCDVTAMMSFFIGQLRCGLRLARAAAAATGRSGHRRRRRA